MDKLEIECKQGEKLKKIIINLLEMPDLFSFLYAKHLFISDIKLNNFNINNNQTENNIHFNDLTFTDSEKNFFKCFIDNSDELKQFIEDYLSNIDKKKKEIFLETNFNKDYVFYGFYKHSIGIYLLINVFMCLKVKKFLFEFVLFKLFEEEVNEKLNCKRGQELNELFNLIINFKDEIKNNSDFNILAIKFWNLFYQIFTFRDCITFLGIRATLGSADYFPPKLTEILAGFCSLNSVVNDKYKTQNQPEKKKKGLPSILTVGGRALSKHFHRSSENFWPNCTGKEKVKNEMAFNVANKLIQECCWINIHQLPGDLPIIELRIEEGYGIRWQLDCFFRGFLEPQIPDGHEKGWKH